MTEPDARAAVTPIGIRDGSQAALTGLIARRGAAVLGFCQAVCEPDDAVRAAAEAFARFRAAVAAADDPSSLDPEALLLGATRHAAASMVQVIVETPRRGWRARGRPHQPLCSEIPALLASRADDMLGPGDLDALAQHLDEHAECREIEAAFRRAERAYRAPGDRPLSPDVVDTLLAALAGAAPLLAADAVDLPLGAEHGWDDEWEDEEPEPAPAPEELEPAEDDGAVAWDDDEDTDPWANDEPEHEDAEPVAPVVLTPGPEPDRAPARDLAAAEAHEVEDDAALVAEHDDLAAPTGEVPVAPPAAPPLPAPRRRPGLRRPGLPARLPRRRGPADETTVRPGGEPELPPAPDPGEELARAVRRSSRLRLGSGTALPRDVRPPEVPASHHGPVYALVLPGAAVVTAIIIILAIAGVFGGPTPAPGLIL